MRALITFECAGATLGGTFDDAPGRVGLLIVTGGTEIRIGAHRGLERLARAMSEAGHPTLRFDRRGVGDSEGEDPGFADSGPDIAAAVAEMRRRRPDLDRVIAFGLCDGATALALHHRGAGIDGLILANPWVIEPEAGLPPPAAIRQRYVQRLLSIDGWRRLLSGGIDYRAVLRGVRSMTRKQETGLPASIAAAFVASGVPTTIVIAEGDATAIAFLAEWNGARFVGVRSSADVRIERIATRSHSFGAGDEPEILAGICRAALAAAARPSRRVAA